MWQNVSQPSERNNNSYNAPVRPGLTSEHSCERDLGSVDNLLLFLQLHLYGDRDVPVEATEILVKRDKLCPYKRNIPVHRDEVKWRLTDDGDGDGDNDDDDRDGHDNDDDDRDGDGDGGILGFWFNLIEMSKHVWPTWVCLTVCACKRHTTVTLVVRWRILSSTRSTILTRRCVTSWNIWTKK